MTMLTFPGCRGGAKVDDPERYNCDCNPHACRGAVGMAENLGTDQHHELERLATHYVGVRGPGSGNARIYRGDGESPPRRKDGQSNRTQKALGYLPAFRL